VDRAGKPDDTSKVPGTFEVWAQIRLLDTWAARSLNPFVECLLALQQPATAVPP
jgi:hypothetical protein